MCFYWLCIIIVAQVLDGLNSKGQIWLVCDFHIKFSVVRRESLYLYAYIMITYRIKIGRMVVVACAEQH